MAGWSKEHIASLFFVVGGVGALVLLVFCMIVYKGHGTVAFFILAVAVCTFNPSIIGSVAAVSAG